MDAQVIPPSDWIDFYPPSSGRLAALAALKEPVVTRAQHMAMDFPFNIGRLSTQGKAGFAHDPQLSFKYKAVETNIDFLETGFSQVAKKLVTEGDFFEPSDFKKRTAPGEKEKLTLQADTVESLLRYMGPFLGAKERVDVIFDFDNWLLGPNHTRDRSWHTDTGSDIHTAKFTHGLTPGLVCMARSYGPTDMLKREWVRNGDQVVLHPQAEALIDAQIKLTHAGLFKQDLSRQSGMQKNIDRLTEKLRDKGMVVQAQPYEFAMMSTLTPHRTHNPRQTLWGRLLRRPVEPQPSNFMRVLMMRHVVDSRP